MVTVENLSNLRKRCKMKQNSKTGSVPYKPKRIDTFGDSHDLNFGLGGKHILLSTFIVLSLVTKIPSN